MREEIARLRSRREHSRERRTAENYALREARLASRRAQPRERHAAESSESSEQREARLERHRERDGVARATSRCREESEVHIQRVRVDQQRRLASESADGRGAHGIFSII